MSKTETTVHINASLLTRAQQALAKKLGISRVSKSETAKQALSLLIKEGEKK